MSATTAGWHDVEAAVPRGIANSTPLSAARARNAEVWDVDARRYIDFVGGIGTLATGHCHPEVIAAVRAPPRCFHAYGLPGDVLSARTSSCAKRLNRLAPFAGPARERSVHHRVRRRSENAVKIARIATGRAGRARVLRRVPRPHAF